MQQIKGDSKKTTVIRGGTLITLGLLRELAGLIQADCVGPIVGTALKIIEIVEVKFPYPHRRLFPDSFPTSGCQSE